MRSTLPSTAETQRAPGHSNPGTARGVAEGRQPPKSLNGRMLLGYARNMRDLIAGLVAFGLLLVAASLATSLHFYRKRRQRFRDTQLAQGRMIIAEIPASDDLVLFAEDDTYFHYSGQSIDKKR